MIIESNPRFRAQVVGCGVPSLSAPIVEFAEYQRNFKGVVNTKVGPAVIKHEQSSTALKRPVAFENLRYPSLIEIDRRRLDGGLERVPWPESSEELQLLTLEYFDNYSFVTTLELFLPLTGIVPQRCQWIWSCQVEDSCKDVYQFCPLPEGAYFASYKCADHHGIYSVDHTQHRPITDPDLIATKKSFLSGILDLAKVQEGTNIRGQEFGAI